MAASSSSSVVSNSDHSHCCVPLCTSDARYDPEKKISFHKFSKDPKKRQDWIVKIKRDVGKHFQVSLTDFPGSDLGLAPFLA